MRDTLYTSRTHFAAMTRIRVRALRARIRRRERAARQSRKWAPPLMGRAARDKGLLIVNNFVMHTAIMLQSAAVYRLPVAFRRSRRNSTPDFPPSRRGKDATDFRRNGDQIFARPSSSSCFIHLRYHRDHSTSSD